MAARQKISVRVHGELVDWADSYAVARGVNRSQVVEMALEALRGDAAGGVPDMIEVTPDPGPPVAIEVRTGMDNLIVAVLGP